MMWYETLILTRPDLGSEEEKNIQSYFEDLISKTKGELISFEKWGKYLLAYPVKKNDYGIYFLVRYALPENAMTTSLEEIKTFFKIKCSDFVMRYLNKRLQKGTSLDYQKPTPIDSVSEYKEESEYDDVKGAGEDISEDIEEESSEEIVEENEESDSSKVTDEEQESNV